MKQSFVGIITSDKMNKTRTVEVERLVAHPLYKKRFRLHSKFLAHDPGNEYRLGDRVEIVATRPLSKRKRWMIVRKLGRGEEK